MHIKQVILQGFKTYKEETIVDFVPEHNAILGKNGSGKSNLLDAIQFVLSDKYSHRSEDRSKLLYEGSGREIIAASVILVFDNIDRRFPIEADEFKLSRTIGMKKDQFFLNDKQMNRTDISNMMEAAGLSKSNPYYIVEQGKISSLIKMRDNERLELFKEIAGTHTYEDRRKESKKIMRDTDTRTESIVKVIEMIHERLIELQEEKTELTQYQLLEREHRAIEYVIYELEYAKIVRRLKKLEEKEDRDNSKHKAALAYDAYQQIKAKREETENLLSDAEKQHKKLMMERKKIQDLRKDVLSREKEKELQFQQQQDTYNTEMKNRKQAERELKELEEQRDRDEEQLKELKADYEEKESAESKAKQELLSLQQQFNAVSEKSRFADKRQRDEYFNKKIETMTAEMKQEEKKRAELEKELKTINDRIAGLERQIQQSSSSNELQSQLAVAHTKQTDLHRQRDELLNQRKTLQREEHKLEVDDSGLLDRVERVYKTMMDNDTYRGLESIERYKKEHPRNASRIHGPLIDLFTIDARYYRAVERSVGQALYHVVVEDQQIASELIKYLNKTRGGRVTFIPLDRIQDVAAVPPPSGRDVESLIDKLSFDARYLSVVRSVFNRVLVCPDLNVATSLAESHPPERGRTFPFTIVTLSGDKIDRKAVITGGSTETKKSRIAVNIEYRALQSKIINDQQAKEQLRNRIVELDQELTRIISEIHTTTEEMKRMRREYETAATENQQRQAELERLNESAATINRKLRDINASIEASIQQINIYEKERASAFRPQLTAQEEANLVTLADRVKAAQTALNDAMKERSEAERERDKVEMNLRENVRKRIIELQSYKSPFIMEELRNLLSNYQNELKSLTNQREDYDQQIADYEKAIDELSNDIKRLSASLDKLRTAEKKGLNELKSKGSDYEKLETDKKTQQLKKEEWERKMRELGSISLEGSKLTMAGLRSTPDTLYGLLKETNDQLQQYASVNKKALEQYVSLTEQEADLLTKKKELDDSRKSIEELIEHLDMKKDEAIDRTFKQIAGHFSQVFAEIVPGGKATLVIQVADHTDSNGVEGGDIEDDGHLSVEERKARREKQRTDKSRSKRVRRGGAAGGGVVSDDGGTSGIGHREYTGIGIKVSFPGGGLAETYQLSGGQESVVALSLIFAIQRCDPSPFYLFDEIDSALDPQYRLAVAEMIKKQKKEAQFITTTFSAELIRDADRWIAVEFRNKVSTVKIIEDAEDALRLVELQERQEGEELREHSRSQVEE